VPGAFRGPVAVERRLLPPSPMVHLAHVGSPPPYLSRPCYRRINRSGGRFHPDNRTLRRSSKGGAVRPTIRGGEARVASPALLPLRRRLRCASQDIFASAFLEGTLEQGYPRRGTTGSLGTEHAARQAARPVAVSRGLHRHHRGHVIAASGWCRRRVSLHTAKLCPLRPDRLHVGRKYGPNDAPLCIQSIRDRDGTDRMTVPVGGTRLRTDVGGGAKR
jgi:hypothetical protein